MRVDIEKECPGIADEQILANKYRVTTLDWRKKFVFTLYLWHSFTNFLQTWYERRYCEGVFWDCRWVNFDKYVQSYSPGLTLEICFHSLSLAFFYQFSSNWVKELILKSSVFVLQMDKFRQISTELWLLFQNDFLCIENIPWWGMLHACSAFIPSKNAFLSLHERQGEPSIWKVLSIRSISLSLIKLWGKVV